MRFSLISALKSDLSGTDLNTPVNLSLSTSTHEDKSFLSPKSNAALILICLLDL